MKNKKYGDIGFCIKSKKECKLKKCFRHICHNSNPLNITLADYEGSECCLKEKVKQDENLINEIKKLRENPSDWDYDTAIDDVIETLNQYNIIPAPKTIKLSEVVKRLNTCDERNDYKVIINEMNIIVVENSNFKQEYCYINNNKIFDLSDYMVRDEYKWLYTLWIAGTEIIDDLKGPFEEILNKEIEVEDYGQRTIEYSKLKECLTLIGYTEKHKIDFKTYSWTRYIETPKYRIALKMECGYHEQNGIIMVKLCNIVTSTMTYNLTDRMLDFAPSEITAILKSDFDFILKLFEL